MSYHPDKVKVVALLGNDVQHRNTLATLIKNRINVVGACIVDKKKFGLPIHVTSRSFLKKGIRITISQILARVLYSTFNRSLNKKLKREIFDDSENQEIIANYQLRTKRGSSYSEMKSFIEQLHPEILIVHSSFWVEKEIRFINSVKYVIGGHPGITPAYRGSHSPFWAILNDDLQNIGWTCFLTDDGIDTGPVIEQGRIIPVSDDTYMSLSWRGMKHIAESQAKAIKKYTIDGKISTKAHTHIPHNSNYGLPTLYDQFKYWLKRM